MWIDTHTKYDFVTCKFSGSFLLLRKPWEGTAFFGLCHWHFERNARELEELDSMDCEFVKWC